MDWGCKRKETFDMPQMKKEKDCKPSPIKIFEIKNHTEFYDSKTGILERLFDS